MSKTLISIIIPAYNRAHLIQETLHTVVAQTSPDWECIVVDDGSTDDTVNVVSAFAKADKRIHLFQRENTYAPGGNGARQMGLDRASSDWVMFLDSDDVLDQECIQNRLTAVEEAVAMCVFHTASFKEQPEENGVYWNMLYKGETPKDYLMRFLYQDMPWHTTGVLWNATFLRNIGGWNQELSAWQDWELHVRALTYNPRIKAHLGKGDTYYRLDVSDSIATRKKTLKYLEAVKKAIESIEGKVLNSNTITDPKRHLRFLIYRNLIAYPIKWKLMKLPFQILKTGMQFQTVSRTRFISAYWKERLFAITLLKRILKKKFKLDYYKQMYPETTFLKKRL